MQPIPCTTIHARAIEVLPRAVPRSTTAHASCPRCASQPAPPQGAAPGAHKSRRLPHTQTHPGRCTAPTAACRMPGGRSLPCTGRGSPACSAGQRRGSSRTCGRGAAAGMQEESRRCSVWAAACGWQGAQMRWQHVRSSRRHAAHEVHAGCDALGGRLAGAKQRAGKPDSKAADCPSCMHRHIGCNLQAKHSAHAYMLGVLVQGLPNAMPASGSAGAVAFM